MEESRLCEGCGAKKFNKGHYCGACLEKRKGYTPGGYPK